MTTLQQVIKQQEREFDEKFTEMFTTKIAGEITMGEIKSLLLSQKIELLEKVVEEIEKKITEGIGYGKFGFSREDKNNEGKIAINLDDVLSTLQETIKEIKK